MIDSIQKDVSYIPLSFYTMFIIFACFTKLKYSFHLYQG